MHTYRGKRISDGKWVYGNFFHWIRYGKKLPYIGDGVQNGSITGDEVDPATVGMSIGKKDKHGKDLYQGDTGTLNSGDPFFGSVQLCIVWDASLSGFAVVPLENETDIFGNKYTGEPLTFDGYNPNNFELTGNIHDK